MNSPLIVNYLSTQSSFSMALLFTDISPLAFELTGSISTIEDFSKPVDPNMFLILASIIALEAESIQCIASTAVTLIFSAVVATVALAMMCFTKNRR